MTAPDLDAIAQALFDAFVAGDLGLVRTLCRPDATITQNGATASLDDALVAIAGMRSVVGDHRYEDVRRVIGDKAIVEEHRVVSTTPTGKPVDLAACVVVRVDDDGLITEMDEYVDISTFPVG